MDEDYIPTERQQMLLKMGQLYILNNALNELDHLLTRTDSVFKLLTEYELFESAELNKKLNELSVKAEQARLIVNKLIYEEMDKEQPNEST